jgi:hypothetical protein
MHVTGQCLCGYIKYEATVDENLVVICHCTSCQRNSATAFGFVVGTTEDAFSLVTGSLSSYESEADSGTMRSRTFCPKCGTRIYAKSVGQTTEGSIGFVGLRAGSVDQRDKLVPRFQVWCRSAQPWALIDSLPQFEKQPTPDEIEAIIST